MNNPQIRLLLAVIALVAGAIWVTVTKPLSLGLDVQGGMRVLLQAKTDDPAFVRKRVQWTQEHIETVARIMRNRVDALGVAEPVVYPQGSDRVVVELPGVRDRQKALDTIQQTAKLEFRYVKQLEDGTWRTEEETIDGHPTGYERILGPDGKPVSPEELKDKIFSTDPILSGDELVPNSRAELSPQGYHITFEFRDGEPKRIFEEFTRAHVGKPLAIFLDQKLISAPRINDVIPGKGIIEGRFTADQAKTLANQLNAGALPVPLETIMLTNVEATLGRQAMNQTLVAGIVGLGLVLVFMIFLYKLPGFLACIALMLYTLFSFAIFKLIPVTLTVPGLAGFILSIGMAVDANILIFERMKEERISGKSLRASIETGFRRAFSAIFDSNMCTLITCGILYHFGTGQVRGFALTLAIGVLVSMFTAITVSRTFLLLTSQTAFGQNDRLYGLKFWRPELHIQRRMALWFGISGAIIIPGLIFLVMGGLKPSIEFTGGTELGLRFTRDVTAAQIGSALKPLGHEEARIVMAEGNQAFVTIKGKQGRGLTPEEQNAVAGAIQPLGGSIQRTDIVSGIVSAELVRNAFLAILYASGLIVLYLAFRFSMPDFKEGLKFGLCGIAAMLHDAFLLTGLFAILGYFLNWQVDSLFITAVLTVIGFSVHDSVVIFDRLRENLHHRARGETFAHVAEHSIEQTFVRSINTSVSTLLPLLAMLFLGGPTIRGFITALVVGIISGTYSSIFNATPLLMLWKRASDRSILATAGGPAPRPAPRPVQAPRPVKESPARPAPTPAPAPEERETVPGTAAAADRIKPKKKKRRM